MADGIGNGGARVRGAGRGAVRAVGLGSWGRFGFGVTIRSEPPRPAVLDGLQRDNGGNGY